MDYENPVLHRPYKKGRALAEATLLHWVDAIEAALPTGARTLLDLGCGTGRFAHPIAGRLGLDVLGIEPSGSMLADAPRHPRVRYVRGGAERIPLAESSCDLALLSMVIHHLADPAAAAAELGRVVRPGGRVFLRNCFRGRMTDICFFRYSPAALAAEEQRMPGVAATEERFSAAGFTSHGVRRLRQQTDATLARYLDRMRRRAMSTFELMTEAEIETGLAALERAVAEQREPGPVYEGIDVLLLERKTDNGQRKRGTEPHEWWL